MTSSQPPLTESSVTVIHYYTILFKSNLESQWDSHWQLIARPTDEYWLKTSSSAVEPPRWASPEQQHRRARRLSEGRNKCARARLDGVNCNIHRFNRYSSHACFSSRQNISLSVCREAGEFTSFTVCTRVCAPVSAHVRICLQLVYLPTRTGCVLILMAPQSPRLAFNNEDSTFNNLDRQIKKRIQ